MKFPHCDHYFIPFSEQITKLCHSGLDLQKLTTHKIDDWMFLVDINALSSALLSKLLYAKMNEQVVQDQTISNLTKLASSPLFEKSNNCGDSSTIDALVPYVMNSIRNHADHGNFELTHR